MGEKDRLLVDLPEYWYLGAHGDPVAKFTGIALVLHPDGSVTWTKADQTPPFAPEVADGWRDPADLPPDSRKVIVFYLNKLGKGRQVMARYYRDGELPWHEDALVAVDYDDSGFCAPAGWYDAGDCERCDGEYILPLSFTVLGWRPLPPPLAALRAKGESDG